LPQDEPLQVIVKVSQPSTQLQTFKATYGIETTETTQFLGFELWTLDDPSALSNAVDIEAIGAIDAIEYLQPNYTLSADTVSATLDNSSPATASNVVATETTDFRRLWGLENLGQTGGVVDADIDAPEAWAVSTGQDVVVGVIDTGIDYTHPDLVENIWTNPGEIPDNGIDDDGNGYVDDYYGYDFANNDSDPWDDNGHGTHVAGTIAASGSNQLGSVGVAPNAQVMALKFLDENSSGSTFNAIRAIEYAMVMGADLTNNSWGGSGYSQALQDAIAATAYVGQVFVAAAGNAGIDIDSEPEYPASYDLDNIISVGASDASDQLASFSNYGATSVDIAAPGVGIYSTLPGGDYGFLSGSSMATPHVTGVAALVLSAYPNLPPEELKAILLESADLRPGLINTVASERRLNAPQALSVAASRFEAAASGITDLSFETGLLGWDRFGSAGTEVEVAGVVPTDGALQAVISTGVGALSAELIERNAGLSSGSLNSLGNGVAVEGSIIQMPIAVESGDELTFDWNLLTAEVVGNGYNDFGFFSVDGALIELADSTTAHSAIPQIPSPFSRAAGYQTLSYLFETSGTVTLSFGVMDVADAQVDSALLIDNLSLTRQVSTSAVEPVAEPPEPETLAIAPPASPALDAASPTTELLNDQFLINPLSADDPLIQSATTLENPGQFSDLSTSQRWSNTTTNWADLEWDSAAASVPTRLGEKLVADGFQAKITAGLLFETDVSRSTFEPLDTAS
ncbi:MAG: S8 family peptidase, partial [Elainellaceae cyanobacterium]